MFPERYFARRYFGSRYWPKIGDTTVDFTIFNGRGPGVDGNITPLIDDYQSFFLTEDDGNERYLQAIPGEYLTQDGGDIRYIQSIPPGYITQAEADAQGMPTIEAGGTSATDSPMREVDSNFTLLSVSSPSLAMQTYFNIGSAAVTASKPVGYLATLGSTSIAVNTSAVFIKRAGVAQFLRWS